MAIIPEQDKSIIKSRLTKLKKAVKIICFLKKYGCEQCQAVRELISELETLSTQLSFSIYDIEKDSNVALRFEVDMAPALLVITGTTSRIRFYGLPGGFQTESFLEAIEMIGNERTDLHPRTVAQLNKIQQPIHIQVFVNTKCPYCPSDVIMGHRLASASEKITSEMIDITAFPDLVNRYNVHGVPRVVINDTHYFEGVLPEDLYLEEVMNAITVES
ncbi:MAG: thioredoxin family protein [Bacteroidota bacterium]